MKLLTLLILLEPISPSGLSFLKLSPPDPVYRLPRDPCNKSNWHILDEKGVFYEPAKPDGSLSQINIFSQFQKIRGD